MADNDSLQIASTTDSQASVTGAALGTNESDARADFSDSALANFTESESADGQTTTTSVESPSSERQLLLQRLSEAEREIELPPEPTQPGEESTAVDMQAIREAATRDALEDARALHRQAYQQQAQQQLFSPQAELDAAREQWRATYNARMDQIRPPDMPELVRAAQQSGIGISDQVLETLQAVDGGPEAAIFLLKNHAERQKLDQLPPHLATAAVSHLAARLIAPPRRAISRAPAPIVPVGGSSTRSSMALDEMSYQDYARARERQIKARRKG